MNALRTAYFALSLTSVALLLPQLTAAAAEIITEVAPPPLKTEIVGRPREGYVFAPGHWVWSGSSYRWIAGVWILQHGKASWVADRWEQNGTQWHYVPGHWDR